MAGLHRALPASWYLSAEVFGQEQEQVLYREWFCAGRADQVERPGSLVVVDVAGESVLLVRTRAGELAAHYNVCRHRGSQVVPCPPAEPGGPQATPARKAGSLRCPYHSWTYRLEGDLLRAPWSEEIDGFDPAAFGLHPVGVATWGGFVFLHLTPARGTAPLSMPATEESIHCWATGNRISGSPAQITPRKATRTRSSRPIGRRAAGTSDSAATPSATRATAITPGASASSPMSMNRNDEPQMRAMLASSPHSRTPNASVRLPLPVSSSGLRIMAILPLVECAHVRQEPDLRLR